MRQLFISYARENKPDVEALVRDLDALGCQTWVDSSLRGGQSWWEEILRRIADCDVFLVIVSRHMLNSVACKRELKWALKLNKPVLPVAVERRPEALPSTLSMRQIVDYSKSGREAAFALAGALATLPPAPPLPEQLPEPPPAPLSYLSDLVDQVSQPDPLTHEQQHQILIQLQPALRSADREEREGGRYVLEMFSKRNDLYADVDRTLAQVGVGDHGQPPPTIGEVPADGHDQPPPTQKPPPEETPKLAAAQLRAMYVEARAEVRAEHYAAAIGLLDNLLSHDPDYRDAAALRDNAVRRRDLADKYQQAIDAHAAKDWNTAAGLYKQVLELQPDFRDAAIRREQCEKAQRIIDLQDELRIHAESKNWQSVIEISDELAALDLEAADPDGLATRARNTVRAAVEREGIYARARAAEDAGNWAAAISQYSSLNGYRDAEIRLHSCQQRQEQAEVAKRRQAELANRYVQGVSHLNQQPGSKPSRSSPHRAGAARIPRRRRVALDSATTA